MLPEEPARNLLDQMLLRRETQAMRRIAEVVRSTDDLATIFGLVTTLLNDVITCDSAAVYLYNAEALGLCASVGLNQHDPRINAPLKMHRFPFVQTILRDNQPMLVYHTRVNPDWRDLPGHDNVQSWLGAPLNVHGELVGMLSVSHHMAGYYSATHLEQLTAFIGYVAVLIENARLLAAERASREHAEVLIQVADALGKSLDVNEVLRVILAELKRFVDYDSASLLIYHGSSDTEAEFAKLVVGAGYEEENESRIQAANHLLPKSPILAQMARDLQPVLSDDVHHLEGWIWVPGAEDVRSWIGVPLVARRHMIGALMADNRQVGAFDEEDVKIMVSLAQPAAQAIMNAQLYQESQSQLKQLTNLVSATTRISSSLEIEQVVYSAAEQMVKLLDLDACGISQWDVERDTLTLWVDYKTHAVGHTNAWSQPYPLSKYPLSRKVLDGRRPVQVHIEDPNADPAELAYMQAEHIQTLLMVPLVFNERAIGMAELFDFQQPREFNDKEIAQIQLLANHAAGAIENARLFGALQRQTRELSSLYDMAVLTSSMRDVGSLLQRLYGQIFTLISPARCYIFLYHDDQREVEMALAMEGARVLNNLAGVFRPVEESGLTGWVVRNRQPLLINDLKNDPLPVQPYYMTDSPMRSWLCVPMIARDHVLGAIAIHAPEPHVFKYEDRRFLQLVAGQVAIAIENARLFEAQHSQLLLARALQELGALLTYELGLSEVLEQILGLLKQVMDYDSVSIQLLRNGKLTLAAGHGFPSLERAREFVAKYADEALANRQYEWQEQRRPIVIPDTHNDSRWISSPGAEYIRSWIGAPLLVKDRFIGTLNVDSKTTNKYSTRDAGMVMVFANQAAIAIENARLFEAEKTYSARLEAIYKASLGVTSSLELYDVLNAILKSTLGLLPEAENAHIFLYQDDELTFGAAGGSDGSRTEPFATPRKHGLTYTVATSGKPMIVSDRATSPLYTSMNYSFGAIIGWPLKIGERVVGVMTVAFAHPREFLDDDLQTLRLLAEQAAIAIENARLHYMVSNQALTDPLTDLPNRRALDERLLAELERGDRYGHPFVLIMIDLDNYKSVNDKYGHLAGDRVLRNLAQCLRQSIRKTDFLARFGGDEFAAILPETKLEEVQPVIDKLLQAARKCNLLPGILDDFELTFSIGVAAYPDHTRDGLKLFKTADDALFYAKRYRPGKVVYALLNHTKMLTK